MLNDSWVFHPSVSGGDQESVSLTVKNVAPELTSLSVTPMIIENESATLSGEIVDPGTLDTFTLDIDWGDPLSPNDAQSFALGAVPLTKAADGIDWNPATRAFGVDHQYLDDNPTNTSQDDYSISVTVSRMDRATHTTTVSAL